jgi:alpha-mannosidase
VVEFRYALRPHAGYDPAGASRFAIGLSHPLLTSTAADSLTDSPFRIEPADVLAVAFKPSEDGKAWILRLFGASGADRKARLHWAKSSAVKLSPRMWLSDLSEQPLTPLEQEISVAALDLVTIRIERG